MVSSSSQRFDLAAEDESFVAGRGERSRIQPQGPVGFLPGHGAAEEICAPDLGLVRVAEYISSP